MKRTIAVLSGVIFLFAAAAGGAMAANGDSAVQAKNTVQNKTMTQTKTQLQEQTSTQTKAQTKAQTKNQNQVQDPDLEIIDLFID
ncbi:MAG: hypothetical protein SCH71_15205 [Desulfobulbaceae bacterium]|nr:hypothetical protein [Desulfobulbaceae bacterium]